ncbi:ChrR-like anti-ECFsigma factor [Ancylobacter aquaticus]|uniref:ChrR-like anti-ECFsigma factor n=1 Tax=Ancylobacter aquaticus TaxID=100 RepID=A0A4R1HR18_ANCAQ|nr:ChrR family anti-sigma-E factor [Ancylobacter aquaticus]TCK23643.1 ChrR-like anti-ECFsigma factor [Ancylobacter aquaticus]
MTIRHHATDETLMRYAAGQLPAGPARVLAVHLAGCPCCRSRLAEFDAVGGALLEAMPPAPMAPDAFAAALRAIDAQEHALPAAPFLARDAKAEVPAALPGGVPLPAALRDCEIGPWRWIGLGVRASAVKLPEDRQARLTLLRIGPGRKMPDHGHVGTEFTQVISGSFSDGYGRYGPGDLSEMDQEIEHQPIVDPDGECICLAALEGSMRLNGFFGRLVQPFVRL